MKNLKNVVLNVSTMIIGALMLVFLSQPHYLLDARLTTYTTSGYDLLNFDGTSVDVFVAVSILMIIIFASVLILCSIFGLLENFGVIKGNTFVKVNRFVSCVAAILVMLFAMFALAGIGYRASTATKFKIGEIEFDVGELAPLSVSWGAIINFILAIVLLVVVLLNKRKVSKAKSRKR